MIKQTKFTYLPQGNVFEKQVKTIKEQGEGKKAITKQGEKQLFAICNNKDDFDVYGDGTEKHSFVSLRQRKICNELHDLNNFKNLKI